MGATRQFLDIGSATFDVAMQVAEVGREVPIASAVLQAFLAVHDTVEQVKANEDELKALRDRFRYLTASVVETCGRGQTGLNLELLEDCLLDTAKVVKKCGGRNRMMTWVYAKKDKSDFDSINKRLDRLVNDMGLSGTMKILGVAFCCEHPPNQACHSDVFEILFSYSLWFNARRSRGMPSKLEMLLRLDFLVNVLFLIYQYQAFPVLVFCKRKFLSNI